MSMRMAVILAAGKGTRMKSSKPKVLHEVLGKSMVLHVIDNLKASAVDKIVVILGHEAALVKAHLANVENIEFVEQTEQLGTAHALLQAEALLKSEKGTTMVVCGDTPLLSAETFSNVFEAHEKNHVSCTVVTGIVDDATGYGRIIRDSNTRNVVAIVEEKDATEEQRRVTEFNSGTYCFKNEGLFDLLHQISNDNNQGEYYLPDAISLYVAREELVRGYPIADVAEITGVNDRVALATVERTLSQKINNYWQVQGVTIMNPEATYIGADVVIENDVIIEPNVRILGKSVIKTGAYIGMNSEIVESVIGAETVVKQSVITQSEIGSKNTIGPFAHIRMDAQTGVGNRIGNFVEIKKSTIGDNTNAAHLTYIGDSKVGQRVNFGCGTITVNYNGVSKSQTIIGDDVFIGCNANILAPVTIHDNAFVAAGTTITHDVPQDALAVARAKQENKLEYGKKIKERYKKSQK